MMQQGDWPIAAPIPGSDFNTLGYTESASVWMHFMFSQRLFRVAGFYAVIVAITSPKRGTTRK